MSIFKKNKRTNYQDNDSRQPQRPVITKLLQRIHVVKQKLAGYLNKRTAYLPRKKLKSLLILFCVVFGGSSMYLIVMTISEGNPKRIQSYNTPLPINTSPLKRSNNLIPKAFISKEEFTRIKRFHNLMDSLENTEQGRIQKESILKDRPHLLDSLKQVEDYYKQQQP